MSVGAHWWREAARQPKVGNLQQLTLAVNQDVLWFEVSMQDAVRVTEVQAAQKLMKEHLHV